MFLDAIFLIAKILAVIVVTIAGVTLLYLLVDFIFNCLAERQDVEASIIGVEKEKDFYHHPIFTGLITVFSHFEEEKAYVTFKTNADDELCFAVSPEECKYMKKGQRGILSYKRNKILDFATNSNKDKR